MCAFSQLLLLLLISINVIVYCEDSLLFAEDTLKKYHGNIIFSSVIFRHGDRAPQTLYSKDPYLNESYWQIHWPQGKGQLSKIGKLQEYNLGKWFRKRYDSLIPQGYKYDLLKVESSDLDRTIMSAECFLAGFFPPSSNETWADDGLKWQPVPIRAIPVDLDNIIGFRANCERYNLEKEQFNKSPEALDFYLKHRKIFNYIAANSGQKMSSDNVFYSIENAFHLYDVLFVEKSYNLTLPEWTNSIYPEPLTRFASLNLLLHTSVLGANAKDCTLIRKLVEEMEMKIHRKSNSLFHFYSGHDTTIAGLLTALEMYNDIFILPSYSASLIFELRQKHKNYVVTILYRNSTNMPPQFLHLRGCDHVCTLDKFKALTQHLIPGNWDDECDASLMKKEDEQNNNIIFQQIINSLGLNTKSETGKIKD
ncbi:prostatic acid phosphatase-like [Planococcus citri]|uniref:prostatic acid phosphatase-like n=1 Tax=Planococcus citri TaxID=170843 RepID=UPI0031F7BA46